MIGVMVPSVFAYVGNVSGDDLISDLKDFLPSPSKTYFWTDEGVHHKGDTVTVNGLFSPDVYEIISGYNSQISAELIVQGESGWKLYEGKTLNSFENIPVDERGYFTFTFPLTGNNYPPESDFVKHSYSNRSIEQLAYPNPASENFLKYSFKIKINPLGDGLNTWGDFIFYVNPQKTDLTITNFEIIKNYWGQPERVMYNVDFNSSEGKPLGYLSRLIAPSGVIITQPNGSIGQIPWSVGGYGTYEYQVFIGDNKFSEVFEILPRPFLDIFSLSDSYIRHQPIEPYFFVTSNDYNIQNVNYKIIDPDGNIVLSETTQFTSAGGSRTNGGTYLTSPYMGWEAQPIGSDGKIDTSTFPQIDGTYTLEMNYDGVSKSQSFYFDSKSMQFLIDKITSEFYDSMEVLRTNQDHIDAFGKERSEKYFSGTSDTDFRIQYTKDMNQFQNETLHGALNLVESKIIALDISLDEQTELIFELREKAKDREESNNSQTQYDIKSIIQSAQQDEKNIKLQEQYRLDQELLEKQLQSELDQIKDEIKSKIASTSKIASFVDQTKDPQHYIDRYNNEPTYKEWFDENYPQYSSIYEAVGMEKPVVEPISEPIVENVPEPTSDISDTISNKQSELNTSEKKIINNLKKLIPDWYNVDENSTGLRPDGLGLWVTATIQVEQGGNGRIVIINWNDENTMWDKFKFTKTQTKLVENVENSSATCFKGLFQNDLSGMICVQENLWIGIETNYGETSSAMNQVLEKMNKNESFAKQTVTTESITEITSMPNCGPGTESVNGVCQVIQTEEKSSGGGCLIATATYGSEMATEVQQLRELRDNQLLQTQSGTQFMGIFNDVYYSFSPVIADYERENPVFKEMVKVVITPMISSLSIMQYAESESEVLGLGLSVIALNLGMYLGIPAFAIIVFRNKI